MKILDSGPTDNSKDDNRPLTTKYKGSGGIYRNLQNHINQQTKYMHLRNKITEHRWDEVARDVDKRALTEQVNEVCVNDTNDLLHLAEAKNIAKLAKKPLSSVSPNNMRFHKNNIPTIPNIPNIPAPYSTDMSRKSSHGFFKTNKNNNDAQ